MQTPAFTSLEQRLSRAATQRLSNAMLQQQAGGVAFACTHDVTLASSSPFADIATQPTHSVSVWLPDGQSALAEGSEVILTSARWLQGCRCRITTAVETDAAGWAHFDVLPLV